MASMTIAAIKSRFDTIFNHDIVRYTCWIIVVAAGCAFITWLHLISRNVNSASPYAGAITAIAWLAHLTVYCIVLYPVWRWLTDTIYGLVAPARNDRSGTESIAGTIALAVLAGLTCITLLLIYDYAGHASIAPPGNEQGTQTAGATAAAKPQSVMPFFLQMDGSHLGTFGDFFGGVLNPILTFGTLIGLAITILMQRVQIREARAEANENRNHAQLQAFETTFFHLLNLHAENIQNLVFNPTTLPASNWAKHLARQAALAEAPHPSRGVTVTGRGVFSEVLKYTFNNASSGYSQLAAYRTLQTNHNDILGHYFRHLYQILNLVNSLVIEGNPEIQYKTRKRYTNILRAQLSAHELALLLLNCTFQTVDNGKFRDLLVWYKFLEHLPLQIQNDHLVVQGISADVQWVVFDYFESFGLGASATWYPGAFGKHPVVEAYLKLQRGSGWHGPLPWNLKLRQP